MKKILVYSTCSLLGCLTLVVVFLYSTCAFKSGEDHTSSTFNVKFFEAGSFNKEIGFDWLK